MVLFCPLILYSKGPIGVPDSAFSCFEPLFFSVSATVIGMRVASFSWPDPVSRANAQSGAELPEHFWAWCERRDSNSHGLPHWNLNPARLPIPPLSLVSPFASLAICPSRHSLVSPFASLANLASCPEAARSQFLLVSTLTNASPPLYRIQIASVSPQKRFLRGCRRVGFIQ